MRRKLLTAMVCCAGCLWSVSPASADDISSFLSELEDSRVEERLSEIDPLARPDRITQILLARGNPREEVVRVRAIPIKETPAQRYSLFNVLENFALAFSLLGKQ